MTAICKVLIVEDDPDNRSMFECVFAEQGYRVASVSDGEAASRMLAIDDELDSAVLDILLPCGPDGFALARAATQRGLAVVLVTGDHRHAERLDFWGYRYLFKPFAPSALLAAMKDELARARCQCDLDYRAGG